MNYDRYEKRGSVSNHGMDSNELYVIKVLKDALLLRMELALAASVAKGTSSFGIHNTK